MRKRFEQYPELDFDPISEVEINTKSRHQLPAILVALQYIFTDQNLSEQIFELLEDKITNQKQNTGRMGMSLWEILVLGVVRLNLDIDYDFLLDHANNHIELRGVLGVRTGGVFNTKGKKYSRQTIVDNVYLIDEETIKSINEILVKAGHDLIKKKEKKEVLELEIKSDSYPVERNIHFPTDINLSWDSVRKIFDIVDKIVDENCRLLSGQRKRKFNRKAVKRKNRLVSNIHSKKGANYSERLEKSVVTLLDSYTKLLKTIEVNIAECKKSISPKILLLSVELKKYKDYLVKFSDQLRRRILQGEKIPHCEKVFSIFEPDVEWLQKGKQGNKVELGHNVLVTTDQYHFILDYKTMEGERDNSQPLPLMGRLQNAYKSGYVLSSISFDRGFYSKLSKEGLEKTFTTVIMPSKGRPSKKAKEEESGKRYRLFMNRHSAVESNINELEHCGVNKVPDRGLIGFKRYVGYGVMAYNLKRLGNLVIESRARKKAKPKKRIKRAA